MKEHHRTCTVDLAATESLALGSLNLLESTEPVENVLYAHVMEFAMVRFLVPKF